MTQPRTPLPLPSKIDLAARALAGQGRYGTVTTLAREHGVSRKKVYKLMGLASEALTSAFAVAGVDAGLRVFTREFTEADIERTIVALRVVTPSSIRDIEAMLPIVYGFGWSYGKIWSVLRRAEQRARAFLDLVDLAAIETVALDEMFSQGKPVLAGIDLDTRYLFLLKVHPSRSGEAWAEALSPLRDRQGLVPRSVVKDAGSGLARGVELSWSGAEQRDDLFHAVYRMGKEAYRLERRAYAAIGKEYELEDRLRRAEVKLNGKTERRSLSQKLYRARVHATRAIERYDAFERLRTEIGRVLDLADRGSGKLRTSSEVIEVLTRAGKEMQALKGRSRKVGVYIVHRAAGLGRYLDTLAARLAQVPAEVGDRAAIEATVRLYQAELDNRRGGPARDRKARERELQTATLHLLQIVEGDPGRLRRLIDAVVPVLDQRHRASSAIENLNSVLRPYLVVQKHAEQGFLDLFRFYWNTRERRWGRRKGTSAYEGLTGVVVKDWLTMLGFPPGASLVEARQAASKAA